MLSSDTCPTAAGALSIRRQALCWRRGAFCVLSVLLGLGAGAARADDIPAAVDGVSLSAAADSVPVVPAARIIRDETGTMTAAQARLLAERMPPGQRAEFASFGFSTAAFWFYLPLDNPASASVERLLVVRPTWLDDVRVTLFQHGSPVQTYAGGDTLPFAGRAIANRYANVGLTIPPGHSELLVRVRSRDPVDVAMSLYRPAAFFDENATELAVWGLTYGALGALLLYNLFLYFSIRDRIYLAYAAYLLSFLVMHATLNGYSFQVLWPNSPAFNNLALAALVYLYMLAGLVFAVLFLDLRARLVRAYRLALGFGAVLVATYAGTALWGGYGPNIFTATAWVIVYGPFVMLLGIWSWRTGNRAARFFMLGTASGLTGSFITPMTTSGLLPFSFPTYHAVDFGMMLDAVLLSLALADRISIMRKDKDLAHARMQEVNEHLEERVAERTRELERAKAAAERATEESQTLMDRMPLAFIVWDRDFRVKSWNPAATRIFGYTEEEALGKHPYDFIVPPEAKSDVDQVWDMLLKGDMTAFIINENIAKDGRRLLCRWTNTPVREADGTVRTVLSMAEDITRQRQSEMLMQQWSSAFNHAALGIAIGDVATRAVIACNPAFARMLGATVDEMAGHPILDLYVPSEMRRVRTLMATAEEQGSVSYESRMVRKDGTDFPVQVDLVAIRDEDGRARYRVATVQDITDRRLAMRQLEEKEMAKTRFLAAAGHDLRQPLAAANLFIDALKFSQPNAEQSHILGQLEQAMSTFHGLLDTLLNISKLDAGVIHPEYAAIDVAELMRWLEQNFAALAAGKGLNLRMRFPVRERIVIFSDIGLVKSILMNLVSNAIKFTSRGGVLVGARLRGERVLFQVWDTGIGIQAEHIERIFDEFYQVNNPQRDRASGLGLGLPIARRALSLLGGEIKCHSRMNHGTVFAFELPRYGAPSDFAWVDGEADAESVAGFVRGKRFMLVEDDMLVARATSELIASMGGEVVCFPTAEEALQEAPDVQADCYIVDFMLGGAYNGAEFLGRVQRALGARVVAVILTGDTSTETLRLAQAFDWPVLHKPINVSLLIDSLREQMPGARAQPH